MTQHTEKPNQVSGILEMTLAMILSGTLGYFVFESQQSAYNVVFFRCLFGGLCLCAYCVMRGMLHRNIFTYQTLTLAIIGGIALVANWVLLFSAYHFASISIATAVYHVQPFFLLLISAVLFHDKLSLNKGLWIICAFIGLILVIRLDVSDFSFTKNYIGIALALAAALLYAVATIITKRLTSIKPHVIALVQVSVGIIMLAPLADFSALPTSNIQWGHLGTLGLVHTCIMYILMYSAFQKLPTPAIAVLSFIYPAVAILIDYIFYDQHLYATQFLGIGFILLGSLAVNLNWKLIKRD